jgi:hypothetical protein
VKLLCPGKEKKNNPKENIISHIIALIQFKITYGKLVTAAVVICIELHCIKRLLPHSSLSAENVAGRSGDVNILTHPETSYREKMCRQVIIACYSQIN